MRILFCSHNPLDIKLGASKVLMELAGALETRGARCTVASDEEICPGIRPGYDEQRINAFSSGLLAFLRRHGKDFDVVDYGHVYLPFDRRGFSRETLFVARSVLLVHHFRDIQLPRFEGLRSLAGLLLKEPARRRTLRLALRQADETLAQADLINVSNTDDQRVLTRAGFDPGKIVVLPFGLTRKRMLDFKTQGKEARDPHRVAFIGTFDLRKGARELPEIVRRVAAAVPDVKFRLAGARYRGAAQVLGHFPKDLHRHLEIVSDFEPADLPRILSGCSLGIFPSYVEGFGFGVLEMLAASLPVVAYRAPGPPMMLRPDLMVAVGDAEALSDKVVGLLGDPAELSELGLWARAKSEEFAWEDIAADTLRIYESRLKGLRQQ